MLPYVVAVAVYIIGTWALYERASYLLPKDAPCKQRRIFALGALAMATTVPLLVGCLMMAGVTNGGAYAATTVISVLTIICVTLVFMQYSSRSGDG